MLKGSVNGDRAAVVVGVARSGNDDYRWWMGWCVGLIWGKDEDAWRGRGLVSELEK